MQPLNLPTGNSSLVDENGYTTQVWFQFFTGLFKRLGGTPGFFQLPSYTVASLPSASLFPQCLVYVSNSATGKVLAASNGTHWVWGDGSIVS